MEVLAKALKHAAMTRTTEEQQQKYLANKIDYSDAIRVTSLSDLNCWYGFIYTSNDSLYKLKETLTPDLMLVPFGSG